MKLLTLFLVFFALRVAVYADYVLPYPSYMPGHKLYRISRMIDELKNYWYWGSIAQTKYHQGLSDKYLVEAKTLFEYKQYPLALDALKRSDQHFSKEISQAYEVHIWVLTKLKAELPITFVWQDEYRKPISLAIAEALKRSIEIRNE